jgi:polysaccharide biosynthesis/export protein
MRLSKLSFFCLLFFILFSCTPVKKFLYLQNKGLKSNSITTEIKSFEYKIKPKDVLFIKIIPIDQTTAISLNTDQASTSTLYSSELSAYLNSYDVNDSGIVKLPLIGEVEIKDQTITQCQNSIQKKVDIYLKDALVIVKLLNFKISLLGEVSRPGIYNVYNSKINLLEALSMAGDLTVYGNRKEITLVRQNLPGKTILLDITDKNIIYSDYYYLMPGDIIYIKPVKGKFYGTNPFPFTTVLSTITTLLLIWNYIHN